MDELCKLLLTAMVPELYPRSTTKVYRNGQSDRCAVHPSVTPEFYTCICVGPPKVCKKSSASGLKLRRTKLFKRQGRVGDDRGIRRQTSEPAAASLVALPQLHKHQSYPQYASKGQSKTQEQTEVGSLLIRVVERLPTSATATSGDAAPDPQRASHTPAKRTGPPLSCNFCWNTVDESGRILRRKTQYHCPECRTNLCIVPCFHEYHEGPEVDASASAR